MSEPRRLWASRDLSSGNGGLRRHVGQRPILPDPRRGDRRYRAACEQNGVAADRVVGDRRKANDRTHPQVRSGQLPQGWRLVPAAESYTDCCGTLTATARLAGSDAPRHLSAPRRCRCCPGAQCQAAATARLYRARLKPDEILPRSDDDLGQRRAARLRFNVWCTSCGHRSEPEPAGQARWYCPDTTEPEGNRRLVCGKCGSRDVGFVVSGSGRDPLF